MAAVSVALLLLVCLSGPALSSQEDCGNANVQTAWVFRNTPSSCVEALNVLDEGDLYTPANVVEHVKTICNNAECGQKFVDWLQGPQCRDQPDARRSAVDFSRTVCASFNGTVEGNCLFSESTNRVEWETITAILQHCARWWLGPARGACPSNVCASALQTAVNRVQCCYNNYFGTQLNVDLTTSEFRDLSIKGAMGVSYVNLTESSLLSACNVTNPGTCKTQLTVTVTTGTSLGTADCSNYNVQNAWWFHNMPSICNRAYNGLFIDSDGITQSVVENIETVCNNDDCGQKFVDWLQGPECHDQTGTRQIANDFSQTTCSSFNGSTEGNCLFTLSAGRVDYEAITDILRNCSSWWLGSAQGTCPSTECTSVLKTAVDKVQCCYNNYFGSKLLVYSTTYLFQRLNITGAMGVPNVDITDPALLSACSVPNPGTCQSELAIAGASLRTAASMAVAVAAMLVAVALQ